MKIEYSDLYKFLVSLGLGLIGLAFIVPWLFLKEPFDLLVTVSQLSSLTPTARDVIANRQALVSTFSSYVLWFSIASLFLGLVMVFVGLAAWWFRNQKLVDRRLAADVETVVSQSKDIPEPELIKSAQEEVNQEQAVGTPDEALASAEQADEPTLKELPVDLSEPELYVWYESLVTARLENCFKATHEVLVNKSIGGIRHDFVAIARENGFEDVLAEVKIVGSMAASARLPEHILESLNRFARYDDVYRRPSVGIIIFLVLNGDEVGEFKAKVNEFVARSTFPADLVRVDRVETWQKFNCGELQQWLGLRRLARALA